MLINSKPWLYFVCVVDLDLSPSEKMRAPPHPHGRDCASFAGEGWGGGNWVGKVEVFASFVSEFVTTTNSSVV